MIWVFPVLCIKAYMICFSLVSTIADLLLTRWSMWLWWEFLHSSFTWLLFAFLLFLLFSATGMLWLLNLVSLKCTFLSIPYAMISSWIPSGLLWSSSECPCIPSSHPRIFFQKISYSSSLVIICNILIILILSGCDFPDEIHLSLCKDNLRNWIVLI